MANPQSAGNHSGTHVVEVCLGFQQGQFLKVAGTPVVSRAFLEVSDEAVKKMSLLAQSSLNPDAIEENVWAYAGCP